MSYLWLCAYTQIQIGTYICAILSAPVFRITFSQYDVILTQCNVDNAILCTTWIYFKHITIWTL